MVGKTKSKLVIIGALLSPLALGAVSAQADDSSICFFDKTHFQGAAFCPAVGSRKGRVEHPFGKRFRSVQLSGGTVVHICEYSGFGGRCMLVENSQPNLDALYVTNVESFEVLTVESSGARFFNHVGYADNGVHNAGE